MGNLNRAVDGRYREASAQLVCVLAGMHAHLAQTPASRA